MVLTGQNLEPLRQQLTRQLVTFVQQFSRKVWPTETTSGEALIHRIEIVRAHVEPVEEDQVRTKRLEIGCVKLAPSTVSRIVYVPGATHGDATPG